MRNLNLHRYGVTIIVILVLNACQENQREMKPPIAEKIKKELSIHGDTRIDNYYWLKERDNPKVLEYLKAENAYTNDILKHTEKLQDKIYNEIIGRIEQTDMSVPYLFNEYYYYTRYEEGNEYPIYCRKKGSLEAKEEIMLNVNGMAKGYEYFRVSGLNVSPDNKLLSYGIDTLSRRQYMINIKNLETGEVYPDAIPNSSGSVAWATDNKTFFYTLKDDVTLRSEKIFRHELGKSVSDDKLIYFEEDETFSTRVFSSKSRDYIMIMSYSTLSTEYRFLKSDTPLNDFQILQPRQKDLEYFVSNYEDRFYIRTNYEAKNFRLMEAPVTNPGLKNWKEVIAHRDDVLLGDFEVFRNFLAVNERKEGLTEIRIIDWLNDDDYYLQFDDPTYVAYFSNNPEFDTEILRYGYTSMTTPNSIFDYNMKTKEKELLKQQKVLGGYNPSDYQSERINATAADGTKVPISMVYKKGIEMNGENPLLLAGYGSYGYSYDAGFSSVRLSLLDRGFIYAIAHIRGGSEMGRQWYEDGKLLNKKNTFNDFIDCGEHLIENKYTNPEKLFASGGSAGGLLMGAVINMSPEIFKGVIAAVPFVDVITTMLDESIPLTTSEYDEWGDPRNKEFYDYMKSYSPYDNVATQNYPALLVTTGFHDSQVQYWEPAKWVARLREMKTDDNPLLLLTNLDYGHGGASGRFEKYRETALEYSFLLSLLNIKE